MATTRTALAIASVLLGLAAPLAAQVLPPQFADNKSIPRWVKEEFIHRHMYRDYSITFQMSPYFLKGDFNGDGRRDCAFLIQEKSTLKFGIVIFHQKAPQALRTHVAIIGAGKALPDFGDNIQWADFWRVYPKNEASVEEDRRVLVPILRADAIHLEKKGKKRGLLLWDKNKYVWHKLKLK